MVFLISLLAIQTVGIAVGVLATFFDIESILFSGPLLSFTGVLTAVLGYRRSLMAAFYFGLSLPTMSLLTFCLIFGLQWGPAQAEVPVSRLVAGFGLLVIPLGIYAIEQARRGQIGPRAGKPQFSLLLLLGLMLVASILFGSLRTGDPPKMAAGVAITYAIVAAYSVLRFHANHLERGVEDYDPKIPPKRNTVR